MKKTIIFGVMLTSLLLSGCGGRVVNDVPNDKPSITYKYYEGGYGTYNKSQIDKFNARAKKGEFDFYVKGVPDSAISGKLKSILEQAAESDKVVVPDIVLINEMNPSLNGLKGYLEPLDDVYATEVESSVSLTGKMKIEDKLSPQSLKEKYNFTGHYYGLPMQAGTTGIIYNRKLFTEYKLEVPKTMAEMWALMEDIDVLPRNVNSSINDDIYSLIYPSQALDYWGYITNSYWGQLLGIDAFDSFLELENFDSKIIAYEKYYKAIYENIVLFGLDGPGDSHAITTSTSHTLALASFGQQKALMTICGDWVVNEIGSFMEKDDLGFMPTPLICDVNTKKVIAKATPSSVVFAGVDKTNANAVAAAEAKFVKVEASKVDSSVIPQEDATSDYIYFKSVNDSNTGVTNLVIPAKSKNIDYAKQFMAYLASDEAINTFCVETGSWLPYNYNFTKEDAEKAGLSECSKKAQEVGLTSDSVAKRFKSKGRNYQLLNPLTDDPSYIVKLLQKQTDPDTLYETNKTKLLKQYLELNDKIREYEAANGFTY